MFQIHSRAYPVPVGNLTHGNLALIEPSKEGTNR
jgi:hypothetical protein